jgi:hypothetical protein
MAKLRQESKATAVPENSMYNMVLPAVPHRGIDQISGGLSPGVQNRSFNLREKREMLVVCIKICLNWYIPRAPDAQVSLRHVGRQQTAPSELCLSFHSSGGFICSFDLYCDANKFCKLPWRPKAI